MQKLSTNTKVYNPQTNMEAEIIAVTPDTVTFRSLPVGRPSTTTRDKFEAIFQIISPGGETESLHPPEIAQEVDKPTKVATKKPRKKRRKRKYRRGATATMDPETKRVLRNKYRRRRYKATAVKVRKQSLEAYYRIQAEIKAGIRPPKILTPEDRAKRNQYQREYRAKNSEKLKADRKQWRLAQRPTPRKGRSKAVKGPIDGEDKPSARQNDTNT